MPIVFYFLISILLGTLTIGLPIALPTTTWFMLGLMSLVFSVLQLGALGYFQYQTITDLKTTNSNYKSTNQNNQKSITFKLLMLMMCVSAFLVGMANAHWHVSAVLDSRLAQSITTTIQVHIIGISDGVDSRWRQKARITADTRQTKTGIYLPDYIQLQQKQTWQTKPRNQVTQPHQSIKSNTALESEFNPNTMQAGERWEITAKLKPIRGQASPASFDVEKWQLTERVGATATILSARKLDDQANLLDQIQRHRLRIRQHFQDRFVTGNDANHTENNTADVGILLGLLTGDRALIDPETNQYYKQLGISHLLAISGAHVVFSAWLISALWLLWVDRKPELYLKHDKNRWRAPVFLLMVLFYAQLSGWEIPAQRTVYMVSIVLLVQCLRVYLPVRQLLILVASILLISDPLNVLSPAFWLSFGAVMTLIVLSHRYQLTSDKQPLTQKQLEQWSIFRQKWHLLLTHLSLYVSAQWRIFLVLVPLVLWCFSQVSILSPWANLIAVPFIGLVAMPLDLIAYLCFWVSPTLADLIWRIDLQFIHGFNQFMQGLANAFPHSLHTMVLSSIQTCVLALILLILFTPKNMLSKIWILPCCVLFFIPAKIQAPLLIHVLDVGQGLSVVIQTPNHTLLYDTGGKLPQQTTGMGEKIVVPMLDYLGVKTLDLLMLSHLDTDHSGGLEAVLNNINVTQLVASQPIPEYKTTLCQAGQHWQWDGVDFEILSPWLKELGVSTDNEDSCVLKITAPKNNQGVRHSILLTGDIGDPAEKMMMLMCQNLKSDLLLLGHHGSKFSSSTEFLRTVAPQRAIVTAGFENRYHHPTPETIGRVKQLNIPIDSTVTGGTLTYTLGNHDILLPKQFRDQRSWLRLKSAEDVQH